MGAKTGNMGCPMKGPVSGRSPLGRQDRYWWPDALPLDILQRGGKSPDPRGEDYVYSEAFKALDYRALKNDLIELITDSKPWWPADYGHYDPFFIRMAWHAAGTRIAWPTDAVAPAAISSVSPRSTAAEQGERVAAYH